VRRLNEVKNLAIAQTLHCPEPAKDQRSDDKNQSYFMGMVMKNVRFQRFLQSHESFIKNVAIVYSKMLYEKLVIVIARERSDRSNLKFLLR
jgi:hypothetical protein